MVLEVMRLGEPVLMKEALPVRDFGSPRLRKLVADMWDTMHAEGGVGIAAPQVGVSERIICFGFEASSRYPDAPAVPQTVLINPTVELLLEGTPDDWVPLRTRHARGCAACQANSLHRLWTGRRDHRARGRRVSCPSGAA